ncbi:lipopolysaccharide biosynthesis protein [Sphingopyxis sp. DBS4]|uniref:lipopolysaccharide biosynthesis protein n=1 Tax=Sphingopyxis sp. DBS4 TaxID=2968500 RepID=UPI00214BA596|nr:polysaccharide biosynthesis C-terminal domain-containing protein [Sphingopyxis sp. DBS4]
MIRSSDYTATIAKKMFVVFSGTAASALVARFLGPEMRAEYAFIQNSAAILVVVLNFGLSNYYQSLRRQQGPGACAGFVAVSIKMAALLMLAALLLTGVLNPVHHMILIVACCSLLRLQFQAVSLVENIQGASIATMLGSLAEVLAMVLVWFWAPHAVGWVVCAFISKEFVNTALSLRAIVRGPDQVSTGSLFSIKSLVSQKSFPVVRSAMMRSIPLFFLIVSTTTLYKVDVLIQSELNVNARDIGIYVVGVLVAEYLWIFSDIFKDVQTSRTARGEDARGVASAHRMALFLTIIIYILFLCFGKFAINLVFGSSFSESYEISLLMLIANIFMIPSKVIGSYLISIYNVKKYVSIMVFSLILNVILNFIFIPHWGVYGSLMANILSYSVAGIGVILIFYVHTNIDFRDILLVKRRDVSAVFARFYRNDRGDV